MDLKQKIYTYATQALGFDDCRFTNAKLDNEITHYKKWIEEGHYGDMEYLKEHTKFKENPELLLQNVRSAIVLIKNYKNTSEKQQKNRLKIARYAVGEDYHVVIRKKLEELKNFIQSENPQVNCFCGVDSAPIPERSLALRAGVGFLGKNTMVIKPGLGSYFFIGAILTTAELSADPRLHWNCGNCRICIDACPTHAITENFSLNATQCISYKTIEQKNPLSQEELQTTKGWLFGCDICQEVCPYNHVNTPLTDWKEFLPSGEVGFEFFSKNELPAIPKNSVLYRSKRRVAANFETAQEQMSMTAHSKTHKM